MNYINLHTHFFSSEAGVISIMNAFIDDVFQKNNFYSLGIHPWNIRKINADEVLSNLTEIAQYKNVLAIGECGLDKLIDIDLKEQERIFVAQIKIAEQLRKPLIIHCVRAFDDLIRIKKEMKISVPMIVHGYNNTQQIAEQLSKTEFYLSFG